MKKVILYFYSEDYLRADGHQNQQTRFYLRRSPKSRTPLPGVAAGHIHLGKEGDL